MFLRNAWYVAAWDRQIGRALHAETILGERVVLYRTIAGEPVALQNACPHRKLPLSMGRLREDQIECGYHGLVFDSSGLCIRVPGATRIPAAARVRSYPAISRYGLVWIWMGDIDKADPATIFPVEPWGDPAWGVNEGGSMTVACHYLFLTDNLLDPSHVAWVHANSFADAACEDQRVHTAVLPNGIVAHRWMHDVEVAPFYAPFVRFSGRCDRLQHYEVRYPSHCVVKAILTPAGTGGAGSSLHPEAMLMHSYNFMTPIDADRTRYFWFQTRNFAPGDETVSKQMDDGVRAVFAEDRLILEAVHESFKNQTAPRIDLAIDRAQLLFRQRLDRLIAAERPQEQAAG